MINSSNRADKPTGLVLELFQEIEKWCKERKIEVVLASGCGCCGGLSITVSSNEVCTTVSGDGGGYRINEYDDDKTK